MGFIREFAFATRPDRQPADRIDFTETLYWNSGVKTGARSGRATVKFSLSDSVTTFRVLADAFAGNGALGTGTTVFASVELISGQVLMDHCLDHLFSEDHRFLLNLLHSLLPMRKTS